jgi:hypothetical protein
MRETSFAAEAAACRNKAQDYVGRPERPFLLSLANAFQELAQRDQGRPA